MADNKTLPFTGAGDSTAVFATDDVGGVNYQRVKMTLGADGVNDGDVSGSNPIPATTALARHPLLVPLSQTQRDWYGMCATSGGNVYAAVFGGDIYMQTAEAGNFAALGGTSRNWVGMCVGAGGDVYAAVYGGDIYVQTGGSGSFTALGGTSRNWWGMCAAPNGDIYAVVDSGDIYVQTGGSGSFNALGGTSRAWRGICATPNGDIYATVNSGTVYKRTAGAGSFASINVTTRSWSGIVSTLDGSHLIAAVGLVGDLFAIDLHGERALYVEERMFQPAASYTFPIITASGNLYVSSYNTSAYGDIYRAKLGLIPANDDVVRLKTNKNRALSVYLEDRHVPGRASVIGEHGGVLVEAGVAAHDDPATTATGSNPIVKPTLVGGYASAAAPTDVSADGDAVRAWHLRNGARAVAVTAAGALIGGDATNGLDVDVTRVPTDPFGATADAAVTTDTTGTISGKLRGLIKWAYERMPASLGSKTSANSLPVVVASDQGTIPVSNSAEAASLGATNDAESTGDGSIIAILKRIRTLLGGTLTVGSHAVTNAGTFATQVDGAALTALQLIDDPVIADDSAFTPATSKVMMAGFEADESSTDSVDEGDAGAARMTLDRKVIVTVQPHTAGGLSTFMASGSDGSSILVATAQAIKASAGQMYGYYAYNPEAAVTFVHFYNVAAASVTVGTTNPLFTIAIPAGSAANLTIPQGITFSNAGWSCAATTTAGGNTAPATGVSLVVWYA